MKVLLRSDVDGLGRTGDVVELWVVDGEQRVTLLDRSKSLFKLQQGEHVSPEKVEGALKQCPLVAQVFVHGDATECWPVALLVLRDRALEKAGAATGCGGEAAPCATQAVRPRPRQRARARSQRAPAERPLGRPVAVAVA